MPKRCHEPDCGEIMSIVQHREKQMPGAKASETDKTEPAPRINTVIDSMHEQRRGEQDNMA